MADRNTMNNGPAGVARPGEGDTRRQIMRMLLKHGPITASALGERLGISAAGVRRHLDILVGEGLCEIAQHRHRPAGTTPGRGRPAKSFRLTYRGRSQFGHAYDKLAADALDALREVGGEEAVQQLARKRIRAILTEIDAADGGADSIERTTQALAEAFDRHGYAATVSRAGSGIQICQHHCPVAEVAADHPELCEAEHEIISSLVGLHVQPLASIAEGHGICTTNIPLTPINHTPDERSGT